MNASAGRARGEHVERAAGGVHDRAGHPQRAAGVELVEPIAVRRDVERRLGEPGRHGLVDHEVLARNGLSPPTARRLARLHRERGA